MNLRDLRYLVALADVLHFGKAAEACHVSQPTLSTQIKKLEDELGVALVERAPRHVMLTPAGRDIATRARRVLAEVDQMRETARRTSDPEAGSVRLGLFPTLGPYLLPHVVPRIRARFPRLELLLVEEKTEAVLHMLRDGKLDAAVLAMPLHEDWLETEFLFEEPFLLALPRERAAEFPEGIVQLDDLRDQQVLLLEEGHCMRTQALSLCALGGASERRGFRATSLETLRQMVAANVGMTLLPQLSVMPPVAVNDHLLLRRFAEPQPKRQIGLLWRKSDAREPLMQTLAEILVDSARQVLGDPIPADRREDRRR